jgi:Arc/MetJ-type ribon-helix-helix transcriptional regulator
MKKTSVYLSDEEANDLRQAALVSGRSQADLVREGVRLVIAENTGRQRRFHSLAMGRGDGRAFARWTAKKLQRGNARS